MLPRDEGGGGERVVLGVPARIGDPPGEQVGADLERLGVGVRLAQGGREGLGIGAQKMLTAAAAARTRIMIP